MENDRFKPDAEVRVSPGIKMRPKPREPKPVAPAQDVQQVSAVASVEVIEAAAQPEVNPDPFVPRLEKGMRKGKCADGFIHSRIGPFSIKVSPAQVDRTVSVLSEIVAAARQEGWHIDKESLKIEGEAIEIALSETLDSIPHVPTARELREKERYSWTRIPEKDYFPSGLLKLAITNADYISGFA